VARSLKYWADGRAADRSTEERRQYVGCLPRGRGQRAVPHYAFGGLIGFTSGWVAFVGAVTVPALGQILLGRAT
jgi:hypothetical protein